MIWVELEEFISVLTGIFFDTAQKRNGKVSYLILGEHAKACENG